MSRVSRKRRWLSFRQSIMRLILTSIGRFMGRMTSRDGFWWVAGITAVVVIGVLLSWRFWEELGDDEESVSTTVRNVGLVIGGVVAILLAIWRSRVAERQAGAAQRQAITTQQNLLDERYQRGAEMLGSDLLAVRLGGIYGLQRLAEEHPGQYHIQIMELLCAFVRHPSNDEGVRTETDADGESTLREDVQAVMTAVTACHAKRIKLERDAKFRLELSGAILSRVVLQDGNLFNARLGDADLSGARLSGAKLSETWLLDTNLSDALLGGANLSTCGAPRRESVKRIAQRCRPVGGTAGRCEPVRCAIPRSQSLWRVAQRCRPVRGGLLRRFLLRSGFLRHAGNPIC